jgi:hypothetical protein
MQNELETLVPRKYWITLHEACDLKNLNYKTACNRTQLQPNGGKPDGTIGGKKVFKRETVIAWLGLSDQEIMKAAKND